VCSPWARTSSTGLPLLSHAKRIIRRLSRPLRARPAETGLDYWRSRATSYGPRAVVDLRHADEQLQEVTERQIRELFPALDLELANTATNALDVGCGPGRFTRQLKNLVTGSVIGIEPIAQLLNFAERSNSTSLVQGVATRLPFAGQSFGLIWCCLVLGALDEDEAREAAAEMTRVLRPDGMIALVDNTTPGTGSSHYRFRTTGDYAALLPSLETSVVASYTDLGETMTMMIARHPTRPAGLS
jgi:ubiquinone/menaquinone biosynthesis C-methylase UbiE